MVKRLPSGEEAANPAIIGSSSYRRPVIHFLSVRYIRPYENYAPEADDGMAEASSARAAPMNK